MARLCPRDLPEFVPCGRERGRERRGKWGGGGARLVLITQRTKQGDGSEGFRSPAREDSLNAVPWSSELAGKPAPPCHQPIPAGTAAGQAARILAQGAQRSCPQFPARSTRRGSAQSGFPTEKRFSERTVRAHSVGAWL